MLSRRKAAVGAAVFMGVSSAAQVLAGADDALTGPQIAWFFTTVGSAAVVGALSLADFSNPQVKALQKIL
ncbi:hypothetical protein [Umezawaea sp. NPDC059074]|uniref:hypothetical protein n=1 Tax=Umezawaea sp. NPDC059074 TaxID=3346716 RepID=UPI0036BF8FBE